MSRGLQFVLACPAVSHSCHSENRATGVVFAHNPLFHPDTSDSTETRTVPATRLVVLSAGSFGSPGILERSGIGAKSVLDSVGVKQRVDLPGVGENYQGRVPDRYQRQRMFLTLDTHRSQHIIYTMLFFRRATDIRCDFPK
jgi:choline dehydrogenase-like flavoprotein